MKWLLAFLPVTVLAGTLPVSITPPTKTVIGTDIPATGNDSLRDTTFQYMPCNAVTDPWPAQPTAVTISMPATSTVLVVPNGQRTCVRARVTNQINEASVLTGVGMGVASSNTTTDIVVYDIVKQANKYVLLPVGETSLGVACDMTQAVNGKNVVPNTSVIHWYGTVHPIVVVGTCN